MKVKFVFYLDEANKKGKRAVIIDSFKKEGREYAYAKIYKVSEGCKFPDGDFTPLFDCYGVMQSCITD